MTNLDQYGRPEPPVDGDELATLLGFLDYQRATLAWKCRGLDKAGRTARVGVSEITLGGLLKHMAIVEEGWFSCSLHGHDRKPPWETIDWDADPDWDMHSAADNSAEELFSMWEQAVEESRVLLAQALAKGDLGQRIHRTWPDGRSRNIRWMLCHMIEEYARHNGHADLIRESVDGETGE